MRLQADGASPKVLIVDEDARLLERFANRLVAHVPGVTVLTATNADALRILDAEQIDVLVSDEPTAGNGGGLLAHVTRTKPDLTFLTLGRRGAEGTAAEGAAARPVPVEVLAARIRQALDVGASGQVRGFSLPTLMHLIQMEHKTCTLEIHEGEHCAFLYFQRGELMDAEADGEQGAEALAAVALWPAGEMQIHASCSRRDQRITERPEEIVLRAWVAFDESRRQAEAAEAGESLEDLVGDAAGTASGKGVMPMNRLESVLSEFRDQVPEFVATDLVNVESGLSIGGSSADPNFDASAASASFGEVVRANLRALELLGMGADSTEDILITTARVNILLRMLGKSYYHCLAIGKKGSLGFARAVMKKYEPPLLVALGEVDSQA
jgi:predicted regulator of Ras-like GTPase activity (Roadblock/LC7/MglB family)